MVVTLVFTSHIEAKNILRSRIAERCQGVDKFAMDFNDRVLQAFILYVDGASTVTFSKIRVTREKKSDESPDHVYHPPQNSEPIFLQIE